MKIVIVYIYAPMDGVNYDEYAFRFLRDYNAFPPGIDHDSVVMLNGPRASGELACLFSPLRNCRLLEHDNSGYDIGAFQHAAREVACDMIVFFGASTYFKREGWLLRMATSFQRHGEAQYGAMGNGGYAPHGVVPHIRTTAFWMPPKLMNSYPHIVTRPEERYPFEHGQNCFTSWAAGRGIKSWEVTWNFESIAGHWGEDPNGFHRGNQSSLLAGDRISEPPYHPVA